MSELSLNEIRAVIMNFRAFEQACRELGVAVTEIETELARDTFQAQSLPPETARSAVRRIINERNLREAAVETNMPAAVYLELQQTLAGGATAITSLRDDRPIAKEEFVKRGGVRIQGSLSFDEPEQPSEQSDEPAVRDDGGAYPFG